MTNINPLPTRFGVEASHIVSADNGHHKVNPSKAAFIETMMNFLNKGIAHMKKVQAKENEKLRKSIEGK